MFNFSDNILLFSVYSIFFQLMIINVQEKNYKALLSLACLSFLKKINHGKMVSTRILFGIF
jgi:hypothetical protein